MFWPLILGLACAPAPPPAVVVTVVEAPVDLVALELSIPKALDDAAALELAALDADLGEIDGLVVRVDGHSTPAHRYAPTPALWVATVNAHASGLNVRLCVDDRCEDHVGDAGQVAATIAGRLGRTFDQRLAWLLPDAETKAERKMRRSAAIVYGFRPGVHRRRLGSKWDAVAQAPREQGSTALASWLQGRRDLALGRARLGAEMMDRTRRERGTDRSRFDAVVGFLDAGWVDEAWERSERTPTGDLRLLPVRAHAALARGRVDRVEELLLDLPHHPETARLRFLLQQDRASAAAWHRDWPEDDRGRDALLGIALRSDSAPPSWANPEAKQVQEQVRVLQESLDDAAASARATSQAQNLFGAARALGPVACDDPVMQQIPIAGRAGEAHRTQVERARGAMKRLEQLEAKSGYGVDFAAYLSALNDRLAVELRSAKVLRAYQRRVLLGRSCVGKIQ